MGWVGLIFHVFNPTRLWVGFGLGSGWVGFGLFGFWVGFSLGYPVAKSGVLIEDNFDYFNR